MGVKNRGCFVIFRCSFGVTSGFTRKTYVVNMWFFRGQPPFFKAIVALLCLQPLRLSFFSYLLSCVSLSFSYVFTLNPKESPPILVAGCSLLRSNQISDTSAITSGQRLDNASTCRPPSTPTGLVFKFQWTGHPFQRLQLRRFWAGTHPHALSSRHSTYKHPGFFFSVRKISKMILFLWGSQNAP